MNKAYEIGPDSEDASKAEYPIVAMSALGHKRMVTAPHPMPAKDRLADIPERHAPRPLLAGSGLYSSGTPALRRPSRYSSRYGSYTIGLCSRIPFRVGIWPSDSNSDSSHSASSAFPSCP